MASRSEAFLAADLGASSGRVMLGHVAPDAFELTELHRFRNGPVSLPDGLHWDVLGLYLDVLEGMRRAAAASVSITSIAVDAWAVDYGLLSAADSLLGNPFHYRDSRTVPSVEALHALVPPAELYGINGLQHLPFNTLYQLFADHPKLGGATTMLLIPDLLGFWLSGEQVAEATNASTTGLIDARSGQWSGPLLDRLRFPATLLAPLVEPGSEIGRVTPTVAELTGLPTSVRLTAVGSHDTASAVAGVPATDPDHAYISCGTWGLVGVELERPVLSEASRLANFTNERGVDGTIRYLRNVMGLWLLQEALRTWQLQGRAVTLSGLLAAAAALPAGGPIVDPNEPRFLPPGDMPERIARLCAETGQRVPAEPAEFVRCIVDSLAAAFADTVRTAGELSGRRVRVVHLVGGGSRNALLCQLTANACGLPVLAGPVEATAIGNVLTQARASGVVAGDRWAARALVRSSESLVTYMPATSVQAGRAS